MKKGWETKSLSDVAEVIAGQSPNGSFYNASGDGLPFYQGKKEFGERFIGSPTTWTSQITKIALEGDVLMSVRAPVGPVNFATEKSCIGRGLAAIRSGKALNRDFLFYFLLSKQDEISGTEGAVFASINKAQIQEIRIGVPPLPEQQRIVALLDEAFDGIATAKTNAEQNLANARALFESHLDAVFRQRGEGWVEHKKSLAELCELIVDCEHKTAPTQEQGTPSIRTPNIGKGKLLLDGVYRVSEETYRKWTRRAEPLPGDLILAREAPAGNVAVIPENLKVCLGQRTVLIRPNRKFLEPEFLALLLLWPQMQQRLLAHSRGATVEHVNMKDIRALDVGGIPPLSLQRDIASVVGAVTEESERLEAIYQRKLAALDELKQSLLHRAFHGEL
ncbi:MAG: restriction endonuclease subunit S [Caldilineaceae bacterium]